MKLIGVLLIIFGLAALAWQGFSYTTREKVIDVGPLEVNKESEKRIPVPPVAGAAALICGIVLVSLGGRR
jgi:uncharacterized membrane protein